MDNIKSFKLFTESIIDSEGNLKDLEDMTIGEIPVKVLDVEKINEDIDKEVKGNAPLENKKYTMRASKLALIDYLEGKYALVDSDLVGKIVSEDEKIKLDIYEDTIEKDGAISIGVVPTYRITTDLKDLKDYIKEEKTLKEFMNQRWMYNSRVKSNIYSFAKKLGLEV